MDDLIGEISGVLCRASVLHEDKGRCPFCEGGVCQKQFRDLFREEASAVLLYLRQHDMLKQPGKKGLLPGLGG